MIVFPKGEFVNKMATIAVLQSQITQEPFGEFSWILNILFYVMFIVFMFYGQRIQTYIMLRDVEGSLRKLKHLKDEGRKVAIETMKEIRLSNMKTNGLIRPICNTRLNIFTSPSFLKPLFANEL